MLILTRRNGEAIQIGDDIRIVVWQRGDQTRVGVDAPAGVTVHREEVQRRVDLEREVAE